MNKEIKYCEDRIKNLEKDLRKTKEKYNLISALRLLVVFLTIALGYLSYKNEIRGFLFLSIIVGLAIFIFLTKIHEKVYQKKIIVENSTRLNKEDILRLKGEFREFKDLGEEYLDINHPFINDLNIFGVSSFFQWVNITETTFGRKKLKELLLLSEKFDKKEVLKRQEALKELSKDRELREKIYSALIKTKKKKFNEDNLIKYAEDEEYKLDSKAINILRIGGPIVTVVALILNFLGYIHFIYPLFIFLINLLILKLLEKEVGKNLELFEEMKFVMAGYIEALEILEKYDFKSEKLLVLKEKLMESGGASKSIRKLYNISSMIYDRKNFFYIIINGIFYFDFQLIYKAEKWKKEEGKKLREYFESFGEFEALESLSILAIERKGYKLSEITDEFEIEAIDLSHPMIKGEAVANSFSLNGKERVALITGSNMSGKSTFLRTIGFSSFLSYLGVPIKGEYFKLPIMNIYSLMRTADNLDENISSFYAEILRVKYIVEASEKGEKVLFLLDEIFKGTNSIDRHEGATVLIKQLLKGKTMGLVSTHDLELCDLDKENKEIVNYNFREYYKENKLTFDYKLREGVSKTRNAKYLMKMAGIDI